MTFGEDNAEDIQIQKIIGFVNGGQKEEHQNGVWKIWKFIYELLSSNLNYY